VAAAVEQARRLVDSDGRALLEVTIAAGVGRARVSGAGTSVPAPAAVQPLGAWSIGDRQH
jgi:hypothetical protein